MLKNYLKIAIRTLLRQKLYTLINICGLALGLSCCIMIFLLLQEEWSFDRHHEKKDLIYRVVTREFRPSQTITQVLQPFELAEAFVTEMPGVIRASGYMSASERVGVGEEVIWRRFALVDPPFLQMFTLPLLTGNPNTALDRPDAIVISETSAHQLFDEVAPDYHNVMGKTLTVRGKEQKQDYLITGIMEDQPKTSSLRAEMLINNEHYKNFSHSDASGSRTSLYIELAPDQNVNTLREALPAFVQTHFGTRIQRLRETKRIIDTNDAYQLTLHPLLDVYHNEDIRNIYEQRGLGSYLYILAGIAFGVLIIACINFTTLSIGQSTSRALEVGMRKVLGAHRQQVMGQFWSEALLMTAAAFALALGLTELFLPTFNEFAQRTLTFSYTNPEIWLSLIITVGLVGFAAGSYPSLVLSRFQPVETLKGQIHIGKKQWLTRGLVILQYALAIVLLIGTGVMLQQVHYMQNKDLGFDREQVVMIQVTGGNATQTAQRYKAALQSYTSIVNIALSDRTFTSGSSATAYRDKNGAFTRIRRIRVDEDYAKTLDLKFVAGRDFTTTADSRSILVNETLVKKLELEDPIGQPFDRYNLGDLKAPVILGIIKDFHMDRLQKEIEPLVLYIFPTGNSMRAVFVRIQPERARETLAFMKTTWEKVVPDLPYRQSFLDENLNRQYQSEQRAGQIVSYAALFAILISCLGLLGLASLSVARRTKEIGIRKILGASVPRLIGLLSWDFVKLLIISNTIAWPIAYWMMNKWLAEFAYRIDLDIRVFIFTGILTLAIAFATVGLKTIKAARSNPVDALKYE